MWADPIERRHSGRVSRVDYLGFNFFQDSPRYQSFEDYRSIAVKLPDLPKVAIAVSPDREMIADLQIRNRFLPIPLPCG